MYRNALVLMFAAAPLMAQQTPPGRRSPTPRTRRGCRRCRAARADAMRRCAGRPGRCDARGAGRASRRRRGRRASAANAMRMLATSHERDQARGAAMDALANARQHRGDSPDAVQPRCAADDSSTGQGFGEGFGKGSGRHSSGGYAPTAPQGWAPQDPADSLWRAGAAGDEPRRLPPRRGPVQGYSGEAAELGVRVRRALLGGVLALSRRRHDRTAGSARRARPAQEQVSERPHARRRGSRRSPRASPACSPRAGLATRIS